MVRGCKNHHDAGFGYHLTVRPTRGELRSEETFICAPCMGAITSKKLTGYGPVSRSDLIRFIHMITGANRE